MKRFFKTLLLTIVTLATVLLLLWSLLNIAKYILYPEYYRQAERISVIPNLNSGFIPQGLCYDAESDTYIHSGYHDNQTEIHLVTNNRIKTVYPLNADGTRANGHAGGVSRAGDYLYVCDNEREGTGTSGMLRIYRFSDLQTADDGEGIVPVGNFAVDTAASFCFADKQYLYVGEFYRAGNYETPSSHHYTTPSGEENRALVSAYKVNERGEIERSVPEFSVSVTSLVQGIAVTADGKIVLSRSWGLHSSALEIHSGWVRDGEATISVCGEEVPLYYLDTSTLERSVSMPAFSEGITLVGDRVAVTFESASNRYIIGKLFFADHVIAYPIN